MNRLGDIWRSTRLPLIIAVAPFALVWGAIPGGPGELIAPAYIALLLFALMTQDSGLLERGIAPRLTIMQGTGEHDLSLVRTTRAAAGIATAVIALVALIMGSPGLTLILLLTLVVVIALAALPFDAAPLRFVEAFWPASMLLLPLVLAGALTDEQTPRSIVAASSLGALMVSSGVLICLIRDRAADLTDGLSSTVTRLGSGVGQVFLFLTLAVGAVIAIWGASLGWWHWAASATAILGSLGAIWAVGSGQPTAAAPVWWIGQAATAIVIAATITVAG